MKKSKRVGNKIKRSLALFMAIVIGASSVNLSAFAEETTAELEAYFVEQTESEFVGGTEETEESETVEITGEAEESENVDADKETSAVKEMETVVETIATEEEISESIGEESPVEIESINDAGTEDRIALVLNEQITVNVSEVTTDNMVRFGFTPEESGRYSIQVNGDLEYYSMLFGNEDNGWTWADNKYARFLNEENLYECDVYVSGSETINVMVTKCREIDGIEIIEEPHQKNYMASDDYIGLYLEGIKIRVAYSDGTEEILSDGRTVLEDGGRIEQINSIDGSVPGVYPVVFEIDGKQVSFDIHVLSEEDYYGTMEPLYEGRNAINYDAGTTQFAFTPTVDGEYSFRALVGNEGVEDYNIYVNVSGPDIGSHSAWGSTKIAQELTAGVTYVYTVTSDVEQAGVIEVEALKRITGLSLEKLPYKTVYMVGENGVNLDGAEILVTFEDGTTELCFAYSCLEDGRYFDVQENIEDWSQAGTYYPTISIGGQEIFFEITLMNEEDYYGAMVPLYENQRNEVSYNYGLTQFSFTPTEDGTYSFKAMLGAGEEVYDGIFAKLNGPDIGEMSVWGSEKIAQKLTAGVTYVYTVTSDVEQAGVIEIETLKMITGLSWEKMPYKTVYMVGENWLDMDGAEVLVTFEDGTTELCSVYGNLADGRHFSVQENVEDWSEAGTYYPTVSMDGYEISFELVLMTEEDYQATRQNLMLGDELEVALKYGDNEFRFIPETDGEYTFEFGRSEWDLSGIQYSIGLVCDEDYAEYSWSQDGITAVMDAGKEYILRLRLFEEVQTKISVEKIKAVTGLAIVQLPYKQVYKTGDYLTNDGLRVIVTFEDGTTVNVSAYESFSETDYRSIWTDESGADFYTPGNYSIKVYYGKLAEYFDIQVINEEEYLAALPEISEGTVTKADMETKMKEFRFTPSKSGRYIFKVIDSDGYEGNTSGYITGGEYISEYADIGISLAAGTTYVYRVNNYGESTKLNIEPIYVPGISQFYMDRVPYVVNFKVRTDGTQGIVSLDGSRFHIIYDDGSEEYVETLGSAKYQGAFWLSQDIDWSVPGNYEVTVFLEQAGIQYSTVFTIHVLSEEEYIRTLINVEENLTNVVSLSAYDGAGKKFEFTFTPSETGFYSINVWNTNGNGLSDLSVLNEDVVLEANGGLGKYISELTGGKTYAFEINKNYYDQSEDEIDVLITKQDRKQITELVLNQEPTQVKYKVVSEGMPSESNFLGFSLDVKFADGTKETLENQYQLSDGRKLVFDSSKVDWHKPGTYICTLSIDGVETYFNVEILDVNEYLDSLPVLSEKEIDCTSNYTRVKFTPVESGSYLISLISKEGSQIRGGCSLKNAYSDEEVSITSYLNEIDKMVYEVYLTGGETYMVSLHGYSESEYGVKIEKALEVNQVKIVSLPNRTTFVSDIDYYGDIYAARGLSAEIEYVDGTKEILAMGDMGKDGRGLRIDYSYDDFLAKNTTIKVCYGTKYDEYEIAWESKESYLSSSPILKDDGQDISLEGESKSIYQFEVVEDGRYQFVVEDENANQSMTVNLYNSDFSYMSNISLNHNKCMFLRSGKYYLMLQNSSAEPQDVWVSLRNLLNVQRIEIANKDWIVSQMPWIPGISQVDNYKESLEVQMLYEDGTSEALDIENVTVWSDGSVEDKEYTIQVSALGFTTKLILPVLNLSDVSDARDLVLDESLEVVSAEGKDGSFYKFTVPETKQYYISYDRQRVTSGDNRAVILLMDENGKSVRGRNIWNYDDIVKTLETGKTYYIFVSNKVAGGNLRVSSKQLSVIRNDLQTIFYNGEPQEPEFNVTLEGKALIEGTDYSVTYVDNVEAGIACAIIKPVKSKAFPECRTYFDIIAKSINHNSISVESIEDQAYTGEAVTPDLAIKDGDKVLKLNEDYEVYYEKNTNVGTARAIVRGIGNYTGLLVQRFDIVENGNVTDVTLDKTTAIITKKSETIALKVTVKPENATDKSVTWSSSNEKVAKVSNSGVVTPVANGTAVITVQTKDGNKKATCEVIVKFPTVATLTNLRAATDGLSKVKLTWSAVLGAEGYLIYAQKDGKYGYVGMTTRGTTFTDAKALVNDYNFYWVFPYVKDADGNMYTGGCQSYKYAKGGVCAAVTNLKAASAIGGVKLTWTASAGAEGYLVYGKTATGKYGYVGMTTLGTTFTDKKASKTEYNFYWVFPYHKDASGKMIVGGTPKYVYGKAR